MQSRRWKTTVHYEPTNKPHADRRHGQIYTATTIEARNGYPSTKQETTGGTTATKKIKPVPLAEQQPIVEGKSRGHRLFKLISPRSAPFMLLLCHLLIPVK